MQENDVWNNCPTEILCVIFKYLDTAALTKCMLVSTRWKGIAEHTIEHHNLWPEVVRKEMTNQGATFLMKSTLDYHNVYKNSTLWNHVKLTDIKHVKTYEIQGVKEMNVYKDNLILITGTHVKYYNIKTLALIKMFESSCLNYDENDNMFVELSQADATTRILRFSIKKEPPDAETADPDWHTVRDVRLYTLQNKFCFVYTNSNVLWAIIRNANKYELKFCGRYYGSNYNPVTALNVTHNKIYIVTKWGSVWQVDFQCMAFTKVYKIEVPQNISHHNWVMFNNYSCVATVADNERVTVHYDITADVIMLACSGLTCVVEHGDVLLLGYNDGRVEIRIPKKNIDCNHRGPERYFNIQQFYEHVDDSTIVKLNIFETDGAHVLLVCTRAHVFQLQLNYPDYLL